jgi:hypothetical protein
MKLLPAQADEASLSGFGREAVSLLERRDFPALADRFGYALAFARSPAVAIEEDLESCAAGFRASPGQSEPVHSSVAVGYFRPNGANLFAVVKCVFTTSEGCPILAELIVTSSGGELYVTLEDISLAGA